MLSPSAELLREAAERRLSVAEDMVAVAVTRTMREWLQAVAFLILQDVMQQRGVTAAGYATSPDEAVDVATAAYNDWRRGVDNNVLPAVSIAFGEGFQQVRLRNRGTGSFQAQQDYMETVADRLRIWPEGAFEKLRPELVEALAEAESIEQIKDRVGRVLEIDTDSRDIKARINEVEIELTDPMLDTQTRRDLRAVRRELWAEHDEALSRWEWKARRIARTEAHGAVNAGQLAAAREAEIDTGEKYHKRWLATEDVRTRATHRVADGQVVPLSGKFRVGGFLLDFPGDPIVVAPHETINCRCTMTILDPDALQDALQGPDSSLGEVRPGGIRLGTDDPDDAMQAIVETAADEHRQLPPDVEARGENHGQRPPPATPVIELTDDRDDPVFAEPTPADVDLTGKTDDELLQLMMDSADDLDGVYEAARDEYDRRTIVPIDDYRDEPDVPAGYDHRIETDDLLGGPTQADSDALTDYLDDINADFAMSDEEHDAVVRWQGMDRFYQRVQRVERLGTPDEAAEDVRDLLDDLMDRNPLPRPIVVWRGLRNLSAMFGDVDDLESLRGTAVRILGFTAVSTSKTVAESFTDPGKLPALLRLVIPAGTGHIWVPKTGSSELAGQRELLLHITDATTMVITKGETPVIEVEVR